jgi:hypothetical protein
VCFVYGAVTHCGALFQSASTTHQLGNSVEVLVPLPSSPTTPNWQRHQALTPVRFGLLPFRSPLLRESLLLSFPRGTEMFQFPRFPLPVLCVHTGVTPAKVPGFPIRTSTVRNALRQLTVAFRSHTRPSSVVDAKASTVGSL